MLRSELHVDGDNNLVAGRDLTVESVNMFFNENKNPLIFFDNDIRDIIVAFSKVNDCSILKFPDVVCRTKAEEKNQLNNLSTRYFENILLKSMCYFEQIDTFLKAPMNEKYMLMYVNTIQEINNKINIFRDEFEKFDYVFNYLYDFILSNCSSDIASDRRLIWVFLHYMYWKCDLGEGGEC